MLLPVTMSSDSPIVFKRTKSKPSSRVRALAVDETPSETTGTEDAEQSPSENIAKVKKLQKARAKPKARVSFGGDDEVSVWLFTRTVIDGVEWFRKDKVKYFRLRNQA